jgi:hypothetical protein
MGGEKKNPESRIQIPDIKFQQAEYFVGNALGFTIF